MSFKIKAQLGKHGVVTCFHYLSQFMHYVSHLKKSAELRHTATRYLSLFLAGMSECSQMVALCACCCLLTSYSNTCMPVRRYHLFIAYASLRYSPMLVAISAISIALQKLELNHSWAKTCQAKMKFIETMTILTPFSQVSLGSHNTVPHPPEC